MYRSLTPVPGEVALISGTLADSDLQEFAVFVNDKLADSERRFAGGARFMNGKCVNPGLALKIYDAVRRGLPSDQYVDGSHVAWKVVGHSRFKVVMYASISTGQGFGIHTDTGAEWDDLKREYSKFTVLVCLSDKFSGGDTQFYDDDYAATVRVQHARGRLLMFDINLPHSGEEVSDGTKRWIGTEIVCQRLS
ncbi:hypothetical protein JKP88DRAFT_247609 [Tribonema minus]|uniref:Fe2OG dioxygenase domain-containing protein n=1 Tax=Tribonema minus TaxID=303371 RepID=A0A835YPG7_9STRA|nr:hypothetical protein JKP88DRAFT_247609 [Tribonema minus]